MKLHKKQNYLTPEISEYEMTAEGLLCGSGVDNVAGGGELEDNSWDYTNI